MSPNPNLTGHLPHDVETALERLRVVRGALLSFSLTAQENGHPSDAEKLKDLWRELELPRDVLKAIETQGRGSK